MCFMVRKKLVEHLVLMQQLDWLDEEREVSFDSPQYPSADPIYILCV